MKICPYLLALILLLFTASAFADDAKPALADAIIIDKIKSRILMDPSISVFKINVDSENGIVHLSGTVNSDIDAAVLIELAQSVEDVKEVDTVKLRVRNSSRPLLDTVITAKVKGILIREKLMGRDVPNIVLNVETNKGIVHLSGTAQTQQQIDTAINLVKSIAGVLQVESQVQLMGS